MLLEDAFQIHVYRCRGVAIGEKKVPHYCIQMYLDHHRDYLRK